MRILFEIVKLLYYLITLGLGILYFKGNELLTSAQVQQALAISLPAYLIFTGILIGYVAYEIFGDNEKQMSGYFIGGTIVGVALVLLSVTTGRGKFEVLS